MATEQEIFEQLTQILGHKRVARAQRDKGVALGLTRNSAAATVSQMRNGTTTRGNDWWRTRLEAFWKLAYKRGRIEARCESFLYVRDRLQEYYGDYDDHLQVQTLNNWQRRAVLPQLRLLNAMLKSASESGIYIRPIAQMTPVTTRQARNNLWNIKFEGYDDTRGVAGVYCFYDGAFNPLYFGRSNGNLHFEIRQQVSGTKVPNRRKEGLDKIAPRARNISVGNVIKYISVYELKRKDVHRVESLLLQIMINALPGNTNVGHGLNDD